MSSRDSLGTGDLIPQDVIEVFAQERLKKRGHKKRSNSLGRALGWLKGKKRKDLSANGQSLGLGPGPDLDLDGHPAGHQGGQKGNHKAGKQTAVPKQEDEEKVVVPPLFQENVFIEASRPKYLEDLHTEAQEGLKLMQQEEINNDVYYQDNESTISTVTVQPEDDSAGFLTDSTIPDASSTVSTQSNVSTRSSRSGLSRQGSTFRPLNSGKKPEKAKTRRRSRKTVMGIPHHVQKELGLDRVGMTISPIVDEEQLPNGETIDTPTSDGPHSPTELQGRTSVSLQNIKVLQPLSEGQVQQLIPTQAVHRDDLALLQRFGPELSDQQRPRSLAVPWMTTANSLQQAQQPPSPVVSMSPQAPYLSKIIPNAVMPPAIEVVEISRGRSRNSVRTVSKSSVLLASPASSRASSRASTLSSASKYKPPKLSDSSGWSHSESSETLVSDSSTISSSSTPRQSSQVGDLEGSAKEDKVSVHSSISRASKSTSNGKPRSKANEVKKEGPFVRNLSVMKSKKAPPPPSRSYSLHNKMNRRSRDLAEVRMISGESSPQSLSASGEESGDNRPVQIKEAGSSPRPTRTIDSPGYTADTSSMDDSTGSISPIKTQLQTPEKEESAKVEEPVPKDTSPEKQQTPQEKELKKIVSPSSGYSSQDGTPTQHSKRSHSSSPRHKKGILAKLQSLFPGPTPAPVVSAPSPLTQPEPTETTQSTEPPQPQSNPSADTVTASPSVRALRELFNIPPPPKVHAPPPPPPEVWAHNKRTFELLLGPPAPDNTCAIVKKNPKDRRQQRLSPSTSKEGSVKSLSVERKQKDHTSPVELNSEIHRENNERLAHVEQHVDVKGNSKVTEKDEKVRVSDLLSGMLAKVAEKREQRLAAMQQEDAKLATHSLTTVTEVKTKMDTLPAITLARISPAPSPPPAHHPPQPPTKQDTQSGTSDAVCALAPQPVVSPRNESSWPPPPPPMEQASGKLPSGHDEMDLPLPPPPLFGEGGFVTPIEVPPEKNIPNTAVLQKSNNEKLDSTCTVTSVMATEAIPLKPSGKKPAASEVVSAPQLPPPAPKVISQGIAPPPETIPPPPPYAAPSAPVKEVSPPPPKVVFPPKLKAVLPPPHKEVSPPLPKEISPLPSKEVSPPLPTEIIPPPPKEFSSPPPQEVLPPPLKEVSPPPPKEIPPPATKAVFPPPPTAIPPPPPKDVFPPPPTEIFPPPPKEVPPPPPKEICLPPAKEVSPPPIKEVSPPLPKEVSPPPPKEISLPPAKDVSPPPIKEVSPPLPKEVSPPPPKEVSPLPPKEVCLMPVTEVSLPLSEEASPVPVTEVSPPAPKEVSPPSAEEVAPLSSQEVTPLPCEEATPSSVSTLSPPQSIPPPPPSELLPPPEVVSPHSDGNHPAPQGPPPPPSVLPVLPSPDTSPAPQVAQEHAPPPPVNIPLLPPLSVQAPANITHQPTPLSTEIQSQEQTASLSLQGEATPMITPSILQVVKLKSVSGSPDPAKPQDQAQSEVTMRTQKPSNQGSAPSASGEAPQKPIRKSLIMTSPTSITPPVIITSPPAVSKAQATVVLPTSSSTVFPTSKKSPPATTTSPSMNLQEAIRLRTAARSKDGPPSRLSLHSPTSPLGGDIHRSPSSTASFIFSKSSKKVVIETATSPEAKSNFQKNLVAELSSVTKSANDAELTKKGVKVPPPVAKKPKAKAKETESSVETEQMQTAGQEAQPESINGTQEKPNGTAGSVEGGQTSST